MAHDYVFDLYRIFFGSEHSWGYLIEVVFRTMFMYSYTLVNVRFLDKRSMGQLTSFEMIIVIALGAAVGDPMLMDNIPLVHGMIVITGVIVLEKILAILTQNNKLDRLIEGSPTLLIAQGKIIDEMLKKEDISREDLFSRLRLKGIANIAEVKFAFMETSGNISVITYEKNTMEGESTFDHLINQRR